MNSIISLMELDGKAANFFSVMIENMGEVQSRIYYQQNFEDLVDALNRGEIHEAAVFLLHDELSPSQVQVLKQLPQLCCFALPTEAWKEKSEWPDYIVGYVSDPQDELALRWALTEASRVFEQRSKTEFLEYKLQMEKEHRQELMNSALELSSERDLSKLYEKTLRSIRRLCSAEGASLFIFDKKREQLRFRHVQNENLEFEWEEFSIPVNENSIAGACAFRKKVIHLQDVKKIPKQEKFTFNASFDQKTGYETKNLLSIPLLQTNDELVGVVQLVNSKRGQGFDEAQIELAQAFASHIAVSLETALLYKNIEELFEGFIKASVTAIESRDPTTSGHSERVADLTVELARKVNDNGAKAFRDIRFNDRQIKELRYASLLHDFGKIGVPENVLVKAKKLYPHELQSLEQRFLILKLGVPERRDEFEQLWKKILEANEPTVLIEELKENLEKYSKEIFEVEGQKIPVLTETEWKRLSVKKGSLDTHERLQIESHVIHTQRFLEQIPWTRDLGRLTEIAAAHHERLNGQGYPHGLKADQIPMESQMMAVTDVFDALTAMDRPYKKAVALPKALDILGYEANDFKLNSELVQLFKEQRVFEVINLKA